MQAGGYHRGYTLVLSCKGRSPRRDGRDYVGCWERYLHSQPFAIELVYRIPAIDSVAVVYGADMYGLCHHHLCGKFYRPRHPFALKPDHIQMVQGAIVVARIMVVGISGGQWRLGMVCAAAAGVFGMGCAIAVQTMEYIYTRSSAVIVVMVWQHDHGLHENAGCYQYFCKCSLCKAGHVVKVCQ